ncbi:MAG: hypothetical protein AYL29_013880 [Candidatus Bathyarchaeota archaeon B24]|nr:MAG: hypothetical protein AYL29_013880 [Candidatus Bathyarchaeota archaeon B24]RLI24023.1 MAG: DUF86 domain-containing protein [Candidatus Bathyarchaeota archaeon]
MSRLDRNRVDRLLTEIREAVAVVEGALAVEEESFLRDTRSIYAVRYAIVKIVEAAALIGSQILEAIYGVAPETYSEVFEQLGKRGVLSPNVSMSFKKLAGLRNILVHRYWSVDDSRVYREAKGNGLKTIKMFIDEIRRYVYERSG